MKYTKEVFYACIVICFIIFIDAYKERTRQQRFVINNNHDMLFDTKTNKTYIMRADRSTSTMYFFEEGDYNTKRSKATGFTSSELFNVTK